MPHAPVIVIQQTRIWNITAFLCRYTKIEIFVSNANLELLLFQLVSFMKRSISS